MLKQMSVLNKPAIGLALLAICWWGSVNCAPATGAIIAPALRLSDGVNTVTVIDNQTGDQSLLVGVVTFNAAVGNWIVNVTTGITKPVLGSAALPEMDLNSVNVTSPGAGMLTIEFTDIDFAAPPGVPGFSLDVGGTTDGTVAIETYADANNAAFGTTTPLVNLGPFTGGAFSAVGSASSPVLAGPYSLTMVAKITHERVGATSFNANLKPVPEPASLAVWGVMSLIGAGVFGRRRRKQTAV